MSGETQLLMEQLVDAVKRTQEYNQYQTLLENVRKRPEIYQRIGEFRRRSIAFQMTDHANPIEENNQLQNLQICRSTVLPMNFWRQSISTA